MRFKLLRRVSGIPRRVLYVLTAIVGVPVWVVGYLLICVAAYAAIFSQWLVPAWSTYGNCWSHTLPLFIRRGGYLLVRVADDVRILRWIPVPHVIWMHELPPDAVIEQFGPAGVRSNAKWVPWEVIWYRGEIRRTETPHPSNWADL